MSRITFLLEQVLALEPYIVAASAATAIASERFLMPAIVVIAVFWLLRFAWFSLQRGILGQIRQSVPQGFGFILLLGLMLVVTGAITAFPQVTMPQVWRTVVGIGLFLALFNALSRAGATTFRITLFVLIGALITLSLLTPVMVEWQGNKLGIVPAAFYDSLPRLFADGVNPNVMAGTLVILLPIPIAVLLMKRAPGQRAVWVDVALAGISLLIGLAVFILTQSRGAYAALVLAAAALVLLRWPKLVIPALVLLVICLIALILQPQWLAEVGALFGNSTIGGLDNRIEIWTRAWYMVQDFSFTGIGMGAFRQVTDLLYPLIITPPGIPHAHNLFLQVAVDLGIPGFIAWMGILVCAFISAGRAYLYGRGWLRALGAGLLASNVALCVHGLTDAVTWGIVRTAPLVWGLWGIALAAGQVALASRQAKTAVVVEPASTTP